MLAETATDGAAKVTPDVDCGAPDDQAALLRFAKGCDVVTFDHEHVPTAQIQAIEGTGVAVRPGSSALPDVPPIEQAAGGAGPNLSKEA